MDIVRRLEKRATRKTTTQKREVFDAMKRNGLEYAAIEAGKLAAALGTQVDSVRVTENDGTVTEWRR